MSSISMSVPTLEVSGDDMQNLLSFIYKHEDLLEKFGAIKIRSPVDCKLALKKRRKRLFLKPAAEQLIKMNSNDRIYSVREFDHNGKSSAKSPLVTDESTFWSSIHRSHKERLQLNVSILPDMSFFSQKTSHLYFDIHRLPSQSLLKLAGSKVVRQFVPCVRRAHGPGAMFPLSCSKQRLFCIDYHHEGGTHQWYIIPNSEREILQRALEQKQPSVCLDHGQLFIDPLVLKELNIRYYRVTQHPSEFVVLSAGTLAQSFTEDASWSESIVFALPSWLKKGYANVPVSLCQCKTTDRSSPELIDISRFKHESIQKYINSQLILIDEGRSIISKGSSPCSK